jgi:hypothetical protein
MGKRGSTSNIRRGRSKSGQTDFELEIQDGRHLKRGLDERREGRVGGRGEREERRERTGRVKSVDGGDLSSGIRPRLE